MKLVVCTKCGSRELLERDGFALCVYCRSRFVLQAEDIPKKDTIINVLSDIQALLQKCISDPVNAKRYASLVLDIDPTNQEALSYLR